MLFLLQAVTLIAAIALLIIWQFTDHKLTESLEENDKLWMHYNKAQVDLIQLREQLAEFQAEVSLLTHQLSVYEPNQGDYEHLYKVGGND